MALFGFQTLRKLRAKGSIQEFPGGQIIGLRGSLDQPHLFGSGEANQGTLPWARLNADEAFLVLLLQMGVTSVF